MRRTAARGLRGLPGGPEGAQHHWHAVHVLVQELCSVTFLFNPWELLHNLPIVQLNRSARHLTKHILSAAKWTLAINWLSSEIPWQQTLHKINAICTMEELTARIQDNMDNFTEIWTPWKMYIITKQLAFQ
ncbi:hypothetical protein XELAEV_18029309mg [Xenopus laevis]|uniref:Uncharacterized protein n=1 Tax=Xenopus laevis TaxID=8355 RepID=A0A974CRR8_XENLA|nr:hypothetical protein XELAEV_18029309mg [Xenopus laevis]